MNEKFLDLRNQEIRLLYASGHRQVDIARRFGITRQRVFTICRGMKRGEIGQQPRDIKIIQAGDYAELADKIKDLLTEGWQLIGTRYDGDQHTAYLKLDAADS